MAMNENEIDNMVGSLAGLIKRTMNRTPTDDEIGQVIDILGGLVAQIMLDLHGINMSLAVMAKTQLEMFNTSKASHAELIRQAKHIGGLQDN